MVRIHLADGSFFVIHAEVFAGAGIGAGVELDEARIQSLKARSELVFARDAALRFLSRAAQTRRGLSRKLRSRGFSREATAAAVSRMTEMGYLDDRVFAEGWTRSRIATRKEGWKSLYRGLLRAGVPRGVAEEVLGAAFTEEAELEKARQLAQGTSARRAVSRLTARGFRSRTIARILSEMRREAPQDPEA
jgi:regulatory protein